MRRECADELVPDQDLDRARKLVGQPVPPCKLARGSGHVHALAHVDDSNPPFGHLEAQTEGGRTQARSRSARALVEIGRPCRDRTLRRVPFIARTGKGSRQTARRSCAPKACGGRARVEARAGGQQPMRT